MPASGSEPIHTSDYTELSLPFDPNGDPLEQIVNKITRKASPSKGATTFQAAPQSVRGIPLQGPTQSSTSIRPRGFEVSDLQQAVQAGALLQDTSQGGYLPELMRLALDRAASRRMVARSAMPTASTVNFARMGTWGANLIGNVPGSLG